MAQDLEKRRKYDREYYQKHREEMLEKKRQYEKIRYQREKERKAAEDAAFERIMKRPKITMDQFTKAAEELHRLNTNLQRLDQLRSKSWFAGWLLDHGKDPDDARRQINADAATWEALLRGERTVPGIALIVGHTLGMTPEEVRNIGITPDPETRKHERFGNAPWHLDPNWPERVTHFPAKKEAELLWGNPRMRWTLEREPEPLEDNRRYIPWSSPKPDADMEAAPERQYINGVEVYKKKCPICGSMFLGRASKRYCQTACKLAGIIKARSGEDVGPMTPEAMKKRKMGQHAAWKRKQKEGARS